MPRLKFLLEACQKLQPGLAYRTSRWKLMESQVCILVVVCFDLWRVSVYACVTNNFFHCSNGAVNGKP